MIKNAKFITVLSVLVLCAAFSKNVNAGDQKLAFVDMLRALNETNEGKKAMKRLERMKAKLQKKISEKEKSIMSMKENLEKQQNVLTQEALRKKAEEYYAAVQELQQSYMQHQRELTAKEAKMTQDIVAKMQSILAEIGRSDGYTMIYDRSSGAVVWAPSHLDLTDKLVQEYNKRYKVKKGKKK